MAEHIATNVCKKHHLQMETLIWLEHYPPRKDSVFHPEPHGSWDLVSFKIEKASIHGYWDYPKGVCVFTSPNDNRYRQNKKIDLLRAIPPYSKNSSTRARQFL